MGIFVSNSKNSSKNRKSKAFFNMILMIMLTLFLFSLILPFKIRINDDIYNVSVFKMARCDGFYHNYNIIVLPVLLKISSIFIVILSSFPIYFLFKKNIFFYINLFSIFLAFILIIFVYIFMKQDKLNVYLYDSGSMFMSMLILFFLFFYFLFFKNLETIEEIIFKFLLFLSIFALSSVGVYIFLMGLPAIFEFGFSKFILGTYWKPSDNFFGILPFIISSGLSALGSLFLAAPFGVLCAVFLVYYAPKKILTVLSLIIKILSSIPSVIIGFLGMFIIVPAIRFIFPDSCGDSLFAVIMILFIMILPVIISFSENSIRSVSSSYLEAALALGQTKTRAIFAVILPVASRGILSGVLFALSRSIGETAAVIMVSGNTSSDMFNLLKPVKLLTTSISLEMAYSSGLHRRILFSIGLVLFVFIFILNILFLFLTKNNIKKINRSD